MLIGPGCRFCGSTTGEQVLDLGRQPPSEHFAPLLAPEPDPVFPLRMWWCARCRLAQLAATADVPEEPAGIEPAALAEQRAAAVEWLVEEGLPPAAGRVAEFSSPHGGSFAGLLGRCGLSVAPAGERAGETADVVLDGCFGLMHAADQRAREVLADERSAGVLDVATLRGLRAAAVRSTGQLRDYLTGIERAGGRWVDVGAFGRADRTDDLAPSAWSAS
jgi:hypothetical protein